MTIEALLACADVIKTRVAPGAVFLMMEHSFTTGKMFTEMTPGEALQLSEMLKQQATLAITLSGDPKLYKR